MFRDIYHALRVELKNVIYKSWYHFIRFGGLLLIPFIYGFSYIFAFYDPFPNVKELQVSVITDKAEVDPFGAALGDKLKDAEVKIGELKMTLKMDHIYSTTPEADQKIKDDSFATIKVSDLSTTLVSTIKGLLDNNKPLSVFEIMSKFKNIQLPQIEISPNYKKNYLIAFGVDVGTAMQGTYVTAITEALDSLGSKQFLEHKDADGNEVFTKDQQTKISDFVKTLQSKHLEDFEPVVLNTNMSEHAKYGYGLAPFFICVAMWIGGMVMTFAVHRKIYDHEVTPGNRYFAKWLLIAYGIVIQATVLMVSLYFIGFKELGIEHWGAMYGFAIIIGLVFASCVQAIRFIIHSRNLGLFLIIILLVLQMASGGGLFPIQTQSGFYQVMNIILPMSKGINIIREAAYQTNWSTLFNQLGYLFIYLLMVPLGVVINHYRTITYYMDADIALPYKTQRHMDIRFQKRETVKAAAIVAKEVVDTVKPSTQVKKRVKKIKKRRRGGDS